MSRQRRASATGPGAEGVHGRVYELVRRIPPGRVATYGQIAEFAGRCTPRMVGYAMASVPHGSDVPWHRVINSRGEISLRGEGHDLQRAMLESEGIEFRQNDTIDVERYRWTPPEHRPRGASRRR